jgi:asparagine synthase (glutamine-hydrolysing)
MGRLVVAHWRAKPELLDPLRGGGPVRSDWLDELLDGRRQAQPATVAFLVNLLTANRVPSVARVGPGSA